MRDLPEPIIVIHKGGIIYFNKAVLSLFGIEEKGQEFSETKESLWNSLGSLIMKQDRSITLKSIVETSQAGLEQETLFIYNSSKFTSPSALQRTKKLFMIKSVSTSGVVEYIFHDVTAWRSLEKNKVKNQCFDVLLATASHDIRTPLNVMLGVIEVLSDYISTERGKEQINVAMSCGQRMLYYLKGLDFIRQINTNTLIAERVEFNPGETTEKILKAMEFSAQSKNINLELTIKGLVPKQIYSDKSMYSIILQNLMENAIKYTFTGGVDVTLSFNCETKMLVTTITDTGIGMTEEQKTHVGTLFKRSRSQTMANPQGMGLGLFLAKTLTNQIDGVFMLESVPGKGTSVSFEVKCDDSFIPAMINEVPRSVFGSASGYDTEERMSCECTKVLMVDDEPFNLLVLSAYLKSENILSDKAVNGKLALEQIRNKAQTGSCCKGYSVIFMDINMPVMDGIESTKQIVELVTNGAIPDCKVVAVTAAAGLDKPEIYKQYVAKGFTELCMITIKYLEQQRML